MHTLCTKKCTTCKFGTLMTGTNKATPACYYLCITGEPRPCPASDKCTVYEKGPKITRAVRW